MNKSDVLRKYYGHTSFRPGQETIIDALLSGRDALAVMPTGGGKSVCYQLPAIMQPGVAVVISPLISLMKDQVMSLKAAGVPAAWVNSTLTGDQIRKVYRNIRAGMYKIVYVAPERLCGEGFLSLSQDVPISLVAVDEAHCISQWGQDFRPSYLKIVDYLNALPRRPPVAALTATATPQVSADIERILCLHNAEKVLTGFDRPNLYFGVERCRDREEHLLQLVRQYVSDGKSGIVYCSTRRAVEDICGMLCEADVPAVRYHAGLEDEEKQRNQDDFLYDRKVVMVATNAFGMGIDKSNVSFVIHYNMPKSIEAYYQEAGRAGRDGEPGDCILLFAPRDIQTAKFLIENGGENEALTEEERRIVRTRDMERLNKMEGYCRSTRCLRDYILSYFGQPHHGDGCGNCSVCRAGYSEVDITDKARVILSCAVQIKNRLGYAVGKGLLTNVLSGSSEKRVLDLGLDNLGTYGTLKSLGRTGVGNYIELMKEHELLQLESEHSTLRLTAAGEDVLYRDAAVTAHLPDSPKKEESVVSDGRRTTIVTIETENPELYERLRRLRKKQADAEKIPAYIVFTNRSLSDMANRQPTTMAEFLRVSGVGEEKAKKYGEVFLAEIRRYQAGS